MGLDPSWKDSTKKEVEVDVKMNVTPVVHPQEAAPQVQEANPKVICLHGNNKGECLICYRIEVGEHS